MQLSGCELVIEIQRKQQDVIIFYFAKNIKIVELFLSFNLTFSLE